MNLKKYLKLSASVLAILLVTACNNGQEEVNPDEDVMNSDVNIEEPANGEVDTEDTNELETEEPLNEETDAEDSSDEIMEEVPSVDEELETNDIEESPSEENELEEESNSGTIE